MKNLFTLLILALMGLMSTTANAAICVTVNNGNFGDPNHWNLGFIPGPQDTVIVNHETYNVTSLSLKRLELNSGIFGNGGPTITVTSEFIWTAGNLHVNYINDGTMYITGPNDRQVQGDLTNNGTITWDNGNVGFVNKSFYNYGSFFASAVNKAFGVSLAAYFYNYGLISAGSSGIVTINPSTWANAGDLVVNSGTLAIGGTTTNTDTIIISAGATLRVNIFQTLELNTGSALLGAGTLQTDGNVTPNIDQDMYCQLFVNGGAVYHLGTGSLNCLNNVTWINGFIQRPVTVAANKTLTISQNNSMGLSSTLTNNGIGTWSSGGIQFNGGYLVNNGTFNITGNIHMQGVGPASFTNNGTTNFSQSGTANTSINAFNTGTINVNSGTAFFGNTYTNSGTVNIANGTLMQINGSTTWSPGTVLLGSGTLRTIGMFVNANVIANPALEILCCSASTGTGSLTINNSLLWTGGNISFPITINPGKTMTVSESASKGYENALLNNQGTLIYNGGGWSLTGTAILDNDGTMNMVGTNVDLGGSTSTLLRNDGTFNFNQTGNASVASAWTNNGVINGNDGVGIVGQNFTNNGTIDVDAGKFVLLNATTIFNSTSVLVGAGVLRNNNHMNLNGTVTIDGNFEMQGFNINGPGNLVVNNMMQWFSSNINTNLTINAGKTLNVVTANGKSFTAGILNNLGTLNYTGNSWSLFGTAILDNDNVMNFNGSTNDLGGNGSTLLRNDGTLNFDHTTNATISSAWTNNGTINVNNSVNANQNFTNNGTIDIDAGKVFSLNNNSFFNGSSVLTGAGILRNNNIMNINAAVTTNCPFEFSGFNINGPGSLTVNNTMNFITGTLNANTTIASGATLNATTANGKTLNATLNNLGTLNYPGNVWSLSGTAILDNDNVMNFNGSTNDLGGNGSTLLRNDGTLNFDHTANATISSAWTNNGTINVNNSVNANQNFTNNGTIDIDAGKVFSLNNNSFFNGSSVLTGAGLLKNTNVMNLNAAIATNCPFEFAGFNINGPGSLTVNNTMNFITGTLSTNTTIAVGATLNATTANGKTLNNATLNNLGSINYSGNNWGLSGNATLDNDGIFNSTSSNTFGGGATNVFLNDGTFINDHAGASTLNFAFNNTTTGTVKGRGTINFNNTLTNNGKVAPGQSPGILTLNKLTNSIMEIEIAGATGGGNPTGHDSLRVTTAPTLGGTLAVKFINGYVPESGHNFIFLTSPVNFGGTFANVTFDPALPSGFTGDLTYGSNFVKISFTVNCPTYYADTDGDGYGDPIVSQQNCTQPSGFVANDDDCDDANANVNPAATEVCNGVDEDCDGLVDEGVQSSFYADADGDGYGDASQTTMACTAPSGYVANDDDCDDANANLNPAATEVCNGVDEDCDGLVDEGVQSSFYADADGDGYGDAAQTTMACTAPSGYVANDDDCDDANTDVNPAATEVCNGMDDDCDGQIDEGVQSTFYADTDGDGYGDASQTTMACNPPSGYVANDNDCDDANSNVNPAATEVCNGMDDDCDGQIDEGVQSTFYADADGDGYGDAAQTTMACTAPSGYVANDDDCDDTNANVNPAATEVCNGMDDDCDGQFDEGVQSTFYADADGDGYGDASQMTMACTAPSGFVANDDDCDDANSNVNPAATEVCNGMDDDCDGQVDETTLALSLSNGTIACAGGTTTLTAYGTGGQSPYLFSLDDGSFVSQNSFTANAGNHTVEVKDANNCIVSVSITITEPLPLQITNIAVTHVACTGGSTGAVDITVAGGTTPYTYHWSNNKVTQDINFLVAGTYSVTVTDAHGCTTTTSAIVNPRLTTTTTKTNVTCNGANNGTASVNINGGTPPYAVQWSNGETTSSIANLAPGSYSVTVTDNLGCAKTSTVNISQPAAVSANGVRTHVSCNGYNDGEIDLTVSNAVPPLVFNWSDGATTEDRTDLFAGTFSVTVTDSRGCTGTRSFVINQPNSLAISYTVVNVSCNGTSTGKVTAQVSGGTKFPSTSLCNGESYCYTWSNGATSRIIDNLQAGTYSVTVTDKNGCVIFGTVTVTEPTALDITGIQIDPTNNGNYKLTVFATGGTLPHRFRRIPGNSNYQSSNIFNNVPAGTYQIVVRDNKLCTDTVEVQVPSNEGSNLVLPNMGEQTLLVDDFEELAEFHSNETWDEIDLKTAIDLKQKLVLFPNPATDEIIINVEGEFKKGELLILDLQGRLLMRQDLEGNSRFRLDISSLSAGLCLVKLQLDGEVFTEKLMVAERR